MCCAVLGMLDMLGCEACSREHQVPFKLDPAPSAPIPQATTETPSAANSGATNALTYPEGTRSIVLGNASLVRPDGSFRAALPVDLDGDNVSDVLLVATDAQGRPSLGSALRRSNELVLQPTVLPLLGEQTRCSIEGASLSLLGTGIALADIGTACSDAAPAQSAPENANPNAPAATDAASRVEHWVVSAEVAPRVLLSLGTRSPAEQSALSLAITSADLDADEHADLRVDVTLRDDGQDPQRLSLSFMNRPSGLARETAEPEQTLSQLATTAGQFLPKDPVHALSAAKRVLTLHRALCKESGEAELVIDGDAGIACGPSVAAGRAAVTLAISLARGRDLFATLDALSALDSPGYKVDAAPRERARKALALIPGDTAFVWHQGPEQRAPEGPEVRLPGLAFVDEGQLLLRGSVARAYQITSGEIATVGLDPGVVMRSADGKLAAVAIAHECEGTRLHVVAATQVIGALAVGAAAGPDDVWLSRAQPDVRCKGTQTSPAQTHVLGFTASGVLAVHGAALWLVPAAGQGEARELTPSDTAAALVSPGAVSADGTRYALATSEGVALVQRGIAPKVTLVRTPTSCASTVSDVALSPSGDRIAMLCDGHVYFAERAGAAPLPSTATPSETPPTAALPAPTAPIPAPNPTPIPTPTPSSDTAPAAVPIIQLPPPVPEH